MKKVIWVILAAFIISLPLGVSASPPGHPSRDYDRQQMGNQGDNQNGQQQDDGQPYRWHERLADFSPDKCRMDRIDDPRWADRFPGKRLYKWHDRRGEGFAYHGRHINDAVFCYDVSDELVSIGFVFDGVFVIINADRGEERPHEPFFLDWLGEHM